MENLVQLVPGAAAGAREGRIKTHRLKRKILTKAMAAGSLTRKSDKTLRYRLQLSYTWMVDVCHTLYGLEAPDKCQNP